MDNSLPLIPIADIQGDSLHSPYADRAVRTRGLITGLLRRGFYMQTPNAEWDGERSLAIFVYSPDWRPELGAHIEVSGEVIDYISHNNAKPVTQIHLDQVRILKTRDETGVPMLVNPLQLTSDLLPGSNSELAERLNSLEGMFLEIPTGQTFIAPSNPFGDYVLTLDADIESNEEATHLRSVDGGVLMHSENPNRWYPGFRVLNYNHAPRVNVGTKLLSPIRGPLHYRVGAWQMAVEHPFETDPSFIELRSTNLKPEPGSITVMTLNCFNLDPHIESADLVSNPSQDIDDDWGQGRFHSLGRAVALQAHCPDVVALQEIQDNDGAEQTDVISADETYRLLAKTIEQLSGVRYKWANIDPTLGADGGQPGGNIRNGFLYNPERVELVEGTLRTFAAEHPAFIDSRKPVLAVFREQHSGASLACINVHLASKRHQHSIFAPQTPGVDEKLSVRVDQAQCIHNQARTLLDEGLEYYITGDFNDTENSDTLTVLCADDVAHNLVMTLPSHERYDYNHRGKLQVLMHGLVSDSLAQERSEYEIIHGNELIGVKPGELSDKPSDHAYVIARLNLIDA